MQEATLTKAALYSLTAAMSLQGKTYLVTGKCAHRHHDACMHTFCLWYD